jgi:hypothetical protein
MVASARLLEGDVRAAADDLARVAALEHGERGLFHTDIDRAHAWLAAELDGLAAGRDKLAAAAADAARTGRHAFEAALLHDIARFGDPGGCLRLGELRKRRRVHSCGHAPHAAGAAEATGRCSSRRRRPSSSVGRRSWPPSEAATVLADVSPVRATSEAPRKPEHVALRAVLPVGITSPILAGRLTG